MYHKSSHLLGDVGEESIRDLLLVEDPQSLLITSVVCVPVFMMMVDDSLNEIQLQQKQLAALQHYLWLLFGSIVTFILLLC